MSLSKYLFIIFFSLIVTGLRSQDVDSLLINANNPFANVTAINLHDIYISRYSSSLKEIYTNLTQFRFTQPIADRVFLMVTVPFVTSNGYSSSPYFNSQIKTESGIGNIEILAPFGFIRRDKAIVGIGPMVILPTAKNRVLGNPNTQFGFGATAFFKPNPNFQFGAKVTYQTILADVNPAEKMEGIIGQPFYIWQLRNGTYLRGAPICLFDLENNDISIPLALGIGKAIRMEHTVMNMFFEPQYSIYVEGFAPQFLIFTGINVQLVH